LDRIKEITPKGPIRPRVRSWGTVPSAAVSHQGASDEIPPCDLVYSDGHTSDSEYTSRRPHFPKFYRSLSITKGYGIIL